MTGRVERVQGLRSSGAAGPHDDRLPRTENERRALEDQDEPVGAIGWTCPRCGAPTPPRETPAGVWCWHCHLKIESCCEGAALPPRKDLA